MGRIFWLAFVTASVKKGGGGGGIKWVLPKMVFGIFFN